MFDASYQVFAGKFRRYHGRSLMENVLDIKTQLLNIRDAFLFLAGTLQSIVLLHKLKPDAVFLKGGFVGVPVGIAAKVNGLPFVTHDSDVIPGLANRLVGRWAKLHAVALPAESYAYPARKTVQVGVIVESSFKPVTPEVQKDLKQQIGAPAAATVLLVTGGSSGAQRLNEAMVKIAGKLLADYSNLLIVHQVGKGKGEVYGSYQHARLNVLEFMRPMYAYTGAADVVVTRAGANAMAELGIQKKPVIVVPSRYLTGGHQVKNAELLESQQAALAVYEGQEGIDEKELDQAIRRLLDNPKLRQKLANDLNSLTIPDAARALAVVLLDIAD